MNVGSIVYTTSQGLGVLAHEFFKHGVIDRVLTLRHPKYDNHHYRYPGGSSFLPTRWEEFLKGLDVLLVLENAFSQWPVVQAAQARGIRVVVQPQYEFSPWPCPVRPDLFLCPSLLDLQVYQKQDVPSVFLPVPVDVPWKKRERCRVFVHNAGHGGHTFRNGTPGLLAAFFQVTKPLTLHVRAQPDSSQMVTLLCATANQHGLTWRGEPDRRRDTVLHRPNGSRLVLTLGNLKPGELYERGDPENEFGGFVFPETFNGLSLPLQEAFASGLAVLATKRFPSTTWLPQEPLIPVRGYRKQTIAVEFDRAEVDPREIAAKLDQFYDRDISEFSEAGRAWAEANSWEVLGPRYRAVLAGEAVAA